MSFVWKVGLFPLDYFNHEMLPSSSDHLAALGLLAGPAEGDQPAPAPDTVHAGTQYSTIQYSTVQNSAEQYSTVQYNAGRCAGTQWSLVTNYSLGSI